MHDNTFKQLPVKLDKSDNIFLRKWLFKALHWDQYLNLSSIWLNMYDTNPCTGTSISFNMVPQEPFATAFQIKIPIKILIFQEQNFIHFYIYKQI